MRLALIVEYEGTGYHGFQYQENAPSIQEELEKAIAALTGESTRVKGAGRTDTGVHARGQVVAFDTNSAHPPETFARALNHFLPDAIAIKTAVQTCGDFDPRRMALRRKYRYTLDCGHAPSPLIRRTSHHVAGALNVRRMRRAARIFVGKHDFAGFAGPQNKHSATTVREVYDVKVSQDNNIIEIDVEANSFLPHQVRRMAGAVVDVGRGKMTVVALKSIVERQSGAPVAHALPPQGLCLMRVTYPNSSLQIGESDGNTD